MFAFLDLFQYVSCKTQTPHKPAKSPTNHPNHPQIRNCEFSFKTCICANINVQD